MYQERRLFDIQAAIQVVQAARAVLATQVIPLAHLAEVIPAPAETSELFTQS